jgi:hypothetical protein
VMLYGTLAMSLSLAIFQSDPESGSTLMLPAQVAVIVLLLGFLLALASLILGVRNFYNQVRMQLIQNSQRRGRSSQK